MAGAHVHLLDIGTGAYGDCVLMHFPGDRTPRYVLIDGGHRSDKDLLLDQFGAILGTAKPYHFDLVMISHAHSDHIGALPELVAEGHITAEHALIPDVEMAFGCTHTDAVPDAIAGALALLREEPPDDDTAGSVSVDALAVDAVTLLPRYTDMIAALTDVGTDIVHFGRRGHRGKLAALSNTLADIGFEVLGPNQGALDRTSRLLSGIEGDLRSSAAELTATARERGVHLDSAGVVADAATRLGHLVNAQSIVCVFAAPSRGRASQRILFGGDFQFADIQTTDPVIAAERSRLLDQITAKAPNAFAKLSHHGSPNAVNDTFLTAIGDTPVVGICCGRGHPKHPDQDILAMLLARSASTSWVRTDRTGHVTVTINAEGAAIMPPHAKNRSEPNTEDPQSPAAPASSATVGAANTPAAPTVAAPIPAIPPASTAPKPAPPPQISAITVAKTHEAISCEIPAHATSMTIRFDLAPAAAIPASDPADGIESRSPGDTPAAPQPRRRSPFQIGGGRPLPKLMFMTDSKRLVDNLDDTAVGIIVDAIHEGGHDLCDLAEFDCGPAGEGIADALSAKIAANDDIAQVVIIGNYDIVPSQQVDSVAKETPPDVAADLRANESDGFIVWSDDPYVDLDQMGLPDLPISRIPDGHSGKFTLKQLQAEPVTGELRHGIRNAAREFVETIYSRLPGANPFLVSTPLQSTDVQPQQLQTSLAYYMLHGMAKNAAAFWGETDTGEFVEALNLAQIPKAGIDIAVLGCCWGALPASSTALDWKPGHPIAGRVQEQSIALTLLAAGARAVIGCTGAHYSPTTPPYDSGAGPLHAALWKHLLAGRTPADALNRAKFDFAARIAKMTNPDGLAIANKSLNQFTCLGLGC